MFSWNCREVPALEKRRPAIEGSIGWDDGEKLVQLMDKVTLSPIEVAERSRLALTFWPSALAASSIIRLNANVRFISPVFYDDPLVHLAFLNGAINQRAFLLFEGVEQLVNLFPGHLAVRLRLVGIGLLFAGIGLRLFLFVLSA